MTVGEIFEEMAGKFDPDAWGPTDAVLQFDVTGEGGGQWYASIEGGELTIGNGWYEFPSLTITCTTEDFVAMAVGELSGVSAFMAGRIRIDGDMSLAMKLQNLLGT